MSRHHTGYLDRAAAAASRGDYLSAMQYGLRAAGAHRDQAHLRCDALLLLAVICAELGDAEAALAYGVGAHLAAVRLRDAERAGKADAIVTMIVAQHPHLSEPSTRLLH
ncbi:MAG TPA: hypothetical protein VD969_07640 [Symbiobacteriaceae bacterium]|nr:hypothetical protein [Symbiobacteriaceae bacterium]